MSLCLMPMLWTLGGPYSIDDIEAEHIRQVLIVSDQNASRSGDDG